MCVLAGVGVCGLAANCGAFQTIYLKNWRTPSKLSFLSTICWIRPAGKDIDICI